MKLNKEKIKENLQKYSDLLIDHLQYSVEDINKYSELTYHEKMIIPEGLLNEIVR